MLSRTRRWYTRERQFRAGTSIALFEHGVLWRYPASAALPSGATFSRADAQTCASFWDASGVLHTAAANVLRNAAYVGSVGTVLLEPAATNLVTRSEPTIAQLGTKSAGVTDGASGAFAPFGFSLNPNGVHFPAVAGQQDYAYAPANLAINTAYAFSVFVIMDDGTAPVPSGSNTAGDCQLVVNGNGGVVYLPVQRIAGTLYRVSGTITTGGTIGTASAGIIRQTGQSGKGFTVCGYQLEVTAYPSSYLATNGTTIARAADSLSLPGVPALSGASTLYQRYWDESAEAWAESATAYTSGSTITPTVGRAYDIIAVLDGTVSAARARSILGVQ